MIPSGPRSRAATLALFCAAAPLLAQQQPAPNATTAQSGVIEGFVYNAITKEPVRRADVVLIPMGGQSGGFAGPFAGGPAGGGLQGPGGGQGLGPGGGQGIGGGFGPGGGLGPGGAFGGRAMGGGGINRATTDAEGRFRFEGLAAGRYTVRAQKTGFLAGVNGQRRPGAPGTPIELTAGNKIGSVRVDLTPQAVISGRVVDEEGEPVQGVGIQVFGRENANGRRRFGPQRGSQTDDRGEFRVTGVAPGTVYLQISPNRAVGAVSGADPSQADMGYAPMFYPGVFDPSQATKIEVTPGADLAGFQMRLQRTRVFRVSGKAVDEQTGQPPTGLFVNLMPRDSLFPTGVAAQFRRMDDGGFELRNVPRGSYILVAGAAGGGGGGRNRSQYRQPLEVTDGNVEQLLIRIPAPVTIAGQFIARDPAAVNTGSLRVALSPADGAFGFAPPARTNADGTFTLENISPGKYRPAVSNIAGGYIDSIRFGEQEVLGQDIDVAAGMQLKIYVSSDGGTVTGTVTKDDQPSPGVPVYLLPVDRAKRVTAFIRTAQSGQDGSFSLANVAPGSYLLLALEDGETGFWEDDAEFSRVESKAVKVDVQKRGSHALTLKVSSMGN